ncbi:uncharacterized protein LOC116091827 [Mastomys coucha]|uniref:uncharacterized protein LOC116091827 n=1 Tax=Mastomys coucha TaxID=35658 RepID=UPI001262A1F7|nr:uncharacterized protein LOC116091827 [Mastomys coucha]
MGCRSDRSPFQACLQERVMGSLHCARICMDVIAAVIGRFRSRPASQPRSPRLADSAAPGSPPPPPPGTKRPGRGGGAGLGSRGRRGRGGVLHCGLQAGGEDLGAGRQLGLNLQVEVSQVVDSATRTRGEVKVPTDRKKKMLRGQGKRGAGSSVSSCLYCRSAWLPSILGASSQGSAHPGSFPALRILQQYIGYASVTSGVESWCVYFRAYLHYHPCSILKDRA